MQYINQDQVYRYFHDNAKNLIDNYLQPDGQGKGWICPICGNGSGEDGDGLVYNPNAPEKGHFHCFVCGFDGDLIDLIGEIYGITDNKEKQIRACREFGIEILHPKQDIKKDFKGVNPFKEAPKAPQIKVTEDAQPRRNERKEKVLKALEESLAGKAGIFSQEFRKAHNKLKDPKAVEYIRGRGITEKNPFLKYMGFIENEFIGKREFKGCIAFFSSNASYAVRDIYPIPPESDLSKAMKPKGAIDIPIGLIDVIKGKDKTIEGTQILEPVFICEGLFDAPSIAEAGGDAIALNGTNNILPVIWAFQEYGIKRPLLLALDNDAGGEQGLDKAKAELEKTNIEFYEAPFIPEVLGFKDANEFLLADRGFFKKQIELYRRLPIREFEKTLNRSKKEKLQSQLIEKGRHGGIKTGFNFLDGSNFLDGGLYSGLYVIGAISSLGKTTFSLQLADQIAGSGQDVIFYSLEMPELEIMGKSISRNTLKDLLENGELEDGEKPGSEAKSLYDIYRNYSTDKDGIITKALDRYFRETGDHLRIIEGIGDINAEDIAVEIDKHIKATGSTPVIFIDYLQLLIQPRNKKHSMTDKQITDANIFTLKQISRDYKTPIFGISSFNRDNYSEPVSMKSFKESGAIEYSSDVLIGLEPEYMRETDIKKREQARKEYKEYEADTGIRTIRLVMLKNRNGRAGGVDLFHYYPKYNLYIEQGNEAIINDFKGFNFN